MQDNSTKTILKKDKQKNPTNSIRRVTARVVSLDFKNKRIILDFFGSEAYCEFEDLGFMKYQDISRIFKLNSVHNFCKNESDKEIDGIRLDYQKIHPEVMKPGKVVIASTCSGSKNLKSYLFKLIGGKEENEENSNDIS